MSQVHLSLQARGRGCVDADGRSAFRTDRTTQYRGVSTTSTAYRFGSSGLYRSAPSGEALRSSRGKPRPCRPYPSTTSATRGTWPQSSHHAFSLMQRTRSANVEGLDPADPVHMECLHFILTPCSRRDRGRTTPPARARRSPLRHL